MSGSFDPYHVWLGIPPEEQPPDHYRLLGIPAFEGNPDVIENAADQRMAHLRTFQAGRHSAESQRLLNEVAAAKVCLLGAGRKASYDAALHQRLAAQTPAGEALDPHLAEFLQRTEAEQISAMRPKAGPAPGKGRPAGRCRDSCA